MPTQTILLIGETGVGKSSFGDALLHQKRFQCGRDPLGVTRATQSGEVVIDGITRCVIDSPGFEDPRGGDVDEGHLSQMVQFLKDYPKGILVIALVVPCTTTRLRQGIQKIIHQMDQMFQNSDIWRHVCLVFSFYGPHFEQDREILSSILGGCLRDVIVGATKINYKPEIPAFFVDSVHAETDLHTQNEICRFYKFAANQERPLPTNGIEIPDCVFLKITKTRETRQIKTESIQVPFEVEVEYVDQVERVVTEEYDAFEDRNVEEAYIETIMVKVPYERLHTRNRFLGMVWDKWTTTEWRDEPRPVAKTRTVQRPFPVKKTRQKTIWVPETRRRKETRFREGIREFWEEIEIETRTTYSGTTLAPLSRIVNTWTKDR
jgi:hypothetical protein